MSIAPTPSDVPPCTVDKFNGISLFAGVGGLELGTEQVIQTETFYEYNVAPKIC